MKHLGMSTGVAHLSKPEFVIDLLLQAKGLSEDESGFSDHRNDN